MRSRNRILVADDDEFLCLTLQEILDLAGYPEPDFVTDGAQALAYLKEEGADLIILDIIMPEKEGIETLIDLRRDYPETKVIAISGGGKLGNGDGLLTLADRFGADITLKKPISATTLLKSVARLLEEPAQSHSPRPDLGERPAQASKK